MVHSKWRIVLFEGAFPSPLVEERLGVRPESGFEQRCILLRTFQNILLEMV